jgi:hypothetical protein
MNSSISYKLKNEVRKLKSVKSEVSQDYAQNPRVNEVNGTYGVQMKGILHLLVRWARCAGTKDFYPALVAIDQPNANMFSSLFYTNIIQFMCTPLPSNLGRQSSRTACL